MPALSQTPVINSRQSNCAPPLTAKQAPWVKALLQEPQRIFEMVRDYGSPLHLVATEELKRNAADLIGAIKNKGLSGSLYFARKANKLGCFVQAAAECGLGIDTAGLQELEECLNLAVEPKRIIVTAVGKNSRLIGQAINCQALIVLDNIDELTLVTKVAASSNKVARIGLRFSGFKTRQREVYSRFGFPLTDSTELFSTVVADSNLRLEMLHAHLDRYDTGERAEAGKQLVILSDQAKMQGIDSIRAIDLGGGILIRYLDSKEQWQDFLSQLHQAVRGSSPAITFNNDGLGLIFAGGELLGQADLYPAFNELSKERFINQVLDHPEAETPLYKQLKERNLEIYFEPGRALLDNCGITIAQVAFRKQDTAGNLLVGAEMNRLNLRPFRAEFCLDPLVLKHRQDRPVSSKLKNGAFIVGCLCSESDFIYKRRLNLEEMPEPGDLLVFQNTGGYLAHHMEIGTHGNPLPINLSLNPQDFSIRQVYK